jgi:hypothetical protein
MRYYGLHLQCIPPLGILYTMAFVTLCKAYMRIDRHFDLRNHFLRIRLPQGSDAEVAVLGGVDIYVNSGHRVDPYFHLPMSDSMDGW